MLVGSDNLKVAIIGRMENYESEKPFNQRYYLDNCFKEVFDRLGVLLIPVISETKLDEVCDMCDGLVMTGSPNDVFPKYYGEKPMKNKEYVFDEYPLVKKTVELFYHSNKPILGICAGIQEINVIFGGTLMQEIPNHKLKEQEKHKLKLNTDSFLYDVYKKEVIEVNSYHKQCIKDIAPNFKIMAISEDGVIEGIQKNNIVAVQWHPEVLHDMKLFEGFLKLIDKK